MIKTTVVRVQSLTQMLLNDISIKEIQSMKFKIVKVIWQNYSIKYNSYKWCVSSNQFMRNSDLNIISIKCLE